MSRSFIPFLGSALAGLCLLVLTGAVVNSGGAPSGRTGAPGNLTCADTGCHAGNDLNADGGSLSITAPTTWQPGTPVDLELSVERNGAVRFGFSITVQDSNGDMVGAWELIPDQGTAFSEFGADISHITHSPAVSVENEKTWQLRWIPPAADVGQITFYAAGNAANGFGSSGDFIYTTALTLPSVSDVETQQWQVIPFDVDAVYPLPTGDRLSLDLVADRSAPVHVHIYDATGRSRIVQTYDARRGDNRLHIDTSGLSSGTYVWRVVMGGHSRTGVLPVVR